MSLFHRVLGLVLICALVLVFAGQVWNGVRASRRVRRWIEGRGRIVALKEPSWLKAPFTKRFPRFELKTIDLVFEYEHEGKLYHSTTIAVPGLYVTNLTIARLYRSLERAMRDQTRMTVWVNPASPEEAVLLRRNDMGSLVCGGLIVLLASGLALVFLR
jgi:hypothetical protein